MSISYSTGTTNLATHLTLEKLNQTLAALSPEPFGKWMRLKRGCPPEEWSLFLPITLGRHLVKTCRST